MKILYFHQHFCIPKGGGGVRSYYMAKKLIARGHNVTMVCGSFGGLLTGLDHNFVRGKREGFVDGIYVIELDIPYSNSTSFLKRAWLFFTFATRSTFIALFHKTDLLLATSTPLTAGIPGIITRWLKWTPFIFEVRDLWPELPREMKVITNPVILGLMSALEWINYKSARRLIGLSPGIIEGIKSRNIPSDKITLIPNGCDLDIFKHVNAKWRPEGVKESDLMAVFTGTHGLANGLDAILDAAAVLKNLGHDHIKFVLIGQGSTKAALQARASQENLDNIIFLDPVPKSQLAKLMKGADLGLQILANVSAFYYGTSPNKFFDYLSSGLPILTNYPGWVANLINENECGYVVVPESSKAFAEAICHAANNKEALITMGENAAKLGKREFSRDDLSDRFALWLEDAMHK